MCTFLRTQDINPEVKAMQGKKRKQSAAIFPVLPLWCFLQLWLFHNECLTSPCGEARSAFTGVFRDGMGLITSKQMHQQN